MSWLRAHRRRVYDSYRSSRLAGRRAGPGADPESSTTARSSPFQRRTPHNIDRFITRPALCEYVPKHRPVQATDAGLVMVSNSPSYLLRLWPPFLNKLLYATDAGLRTFLWIGELPEGLEKPSSQACFDSVQVTQHHRQITKFLRLAARRRSQRWCDKMDEMISNHHVKMPAVLAALAAPGIEGAYYVDLDAVTRYPWTVDPLFASEHTNRYSDVSFKYGFVEGADNSGTLRWKVHGSRFYARNSIKGREPSSQTGSIAVRSRTSILCGTLY